MIHSPSSGPARPGQLNLSAGHPDQARDQLEQSLELCTQDTYPRETAQTHRSLGALHLKDGDYERARLCFETAWKRAVEIAPEGDLAIDILFHRAELSLAVGKAKEAESLALRSQALAHKAGDAYYGAESFRLLGNIAWALGNLDGAETLFRDGSPPSAALMPRTRWPKCSSTWESWAPNG